MDLLAFRKLFLLGAKFGFSIESILTFDFGSSVSCFIQSILSFQSAVSEKLLSFLNQTF